MDTALGDLNRADLQHLQVKDLMRCLSARAFNRAHPAEQFQERWPRSLHLDLVTKHFEKAATSAGTTTDSTWAAPLMVPGLLSGFLPLVKAASVLGKLPLTPCPFNVKIARQTAGSSTAWIGEATPKPISKLAFGNVTLPWSKAVSIIVITKELLQLVEPGSAEQLQATLTDEMTVFVDKEFLSTTAASASRPAGVLAGIVPITATASLATDLSTLVTTFFANRPSPLGPHFVISPGVAAKIAALDMGRNVTVNGGTLLGLPVAVSPGAGANAIVLDAPGVYLADGGIDLDTSEEAMLEMVDAATNPPVAATVFQSLWQTNMIAIRCERFVCWAVVASNAVQYLVVP